MGPRLQAIAAILAVAGFGAVHADTVTRTDVNLEFKSARAAGQLHRNDWYDELASRPARGFEETRKEVIADAHAAAKLRAKLKGPMKSRNYNPYQVEVLAWRSDLYTRGEIRSETLTARAEHMLVPAGESPLPMANERHATFYASN